MKDKWAFLSITLITIWAIYFPFISLWLNTIEFIDIYQMETLMILNVIIFVMVIILLMFLKLKEAFSNYD